MARRPLGAAAILLALLGCPTPPERAAGISTASTPAAPAGEPIQAAHADPATGPAEIEECLTRAAPLDVSNLPDPGPSRNIAPGVAVREVTFDRQGFPMTVWIYTPHPLPAAKLPCVIIAPAGAGLLNGVGLLDEDREEHLPYVEHGYAVLAYSLDGGVDTDPTMSFARGVELFVAADLGIANARAALDYAAEKIPEVDVTRVIAAGHSSAGAHALQVAQNEPRVRACIAYAPLTNLEKCVRRNLDAMEGIHEAREVQWRLAPDRRVSRLRCPTFVFHAEDDIAAAESHVDAFATELSRLNPRAVHVKVESGGHRDAMMEVGIPQAIAWLRTLPEIHPDGAP